MDPVPGPPAVRRFRGATLRELLPEIQAELGEDALILSTTQVLPAEHGRGVIEVAAIDPAGLAEFNRRAAAAEVAPADRPSPPEAPPAPRRGGFVRALRSRLGAAREAETEPGGQAPAGATFAPGGAERSAALAAAARLAATEAQARRRAPPEILDAFLRVERALRHGEPAREADLAAVRRYLVGGSPDGTA